MEMLVNFDKDSSIYQQIIEYVKECILNEEWLPEEQIPAIRTLAEKLNVNANTVQRSYQHLLNQKLIFKKRGQGFYVSKLAKESLVIERRKLFFEISMPHFFKTMKLLNISLDELKRFYPS